MNLKQASANLHSNSRAATVWTLVKLRFSTGATFRSGADACSAQPAGRQSG